MIDPQARPASYFKLMALVVVLGVISALVTFAFIVLVNQSTYRIWEEAAQTLGMDVRLFTILVCTVGGLLVGLLVKLFGDHNGIFADLMSEFGKTGRFDYRNAPGIVITAFVSLASGASLGPEAPLADACGGIGTLVSDKLKLDPKETRTLGFSGVSSMLSAFITSPFAGALLGLESAQGGGGGLADVFLGALSQSAGIGCGNDGLRPAERPVLRDVVRLPWLCSPAGGFAVRCAAGPDRWGGWPVVHAFTQTATAAF